MNFALLQLVGVALPEGEEDLSDSASDMVAENIGHYNAAKKCIEELAIFLKPLPQATGNGGLDLGNFNIPLFDLGTSGMVGVYTCTVLDCK